MRRPLGDDGAGQIGPYRHAHRIAVGGMAEVYRALAPQRAGGDRAVVVKLLLSELAGEPEQRAMFVREAELGARIGHPNVVSVIEHGTVEDRPFIALEYVFGVDLFRLVRWLRHARRTLPADLALYIGCELLAGLGAVHAVTDDDGALLHVVHRDVSPANVFLSVHGEVKLGDLGIARAAMGREGGASARAKGKLGYLPPEQVAGHEVDQRGDLFSAGVVIAELLMGRPLFSGATEIGILLAIRDGDISAFRAITGALPTTVATAVEGALARQPRERVPTADALRAQLLTSLERPTSTIQRELGALVVAAMDDASAGRDETSLAATIEREARVFELVTPSAPTDPSVLRESSGPIYRVDRDGEPVGIYSLASLVRDLTTGGVLATDTVRADDGAERTIATVDELARHLPASSRTPTARRRTQMAETSELYELGGRSMLQVLVDARLGRERGLLLCERGSVRKEIYLAKGLPVFATSNQPTELLGERLVAEGLIDRAELDMALAIMPRFEGRLGETLIALGLIDAVTLFHCIGAQVRERVLDVFEWSSGHIALYRDVDPPERAFPLGLDPWELLLAGAQRRLRAGLEKDAFPLGGVLCPGEVDPRPLALTDLLVGVTLACQRPRAVEDLAGFNDESALRSAVLVLVELDVLRWQNDDID